MVGAMSRIKSKGTLGDGPLDGGIGPDRKIGEQQAGDPEIGGVFQKAIDPVAPDRIEIAEDHDRLGQSRALDQFERAGKSHPLLQRFEGRTLDGRAVGQRVAEWYTDLENVTLLVRPAQRVQARLEGRMAGREIGDERGASPAAQVAPGGGERGLRRSSRRQRCRTDRDW